MISIQSSEAESNNQHDRKENVFDDVIHLIVPLSYSVLRVLNRPHYNDFTDTAITTLPLMELPDTSSGMTKTESLFYPVCF